MSKRTLMLARVLLFISIGSGVPSRPALAWGDEGHNIIALIAERFLIPAAGSKVRALLAADPDDLRCMTSQMRQPGQTDIGTPIGSA